MKNLSDLDENQLVSRLTQDLSLTKNVIAGPGDDCAVIYLNNNKYLLQKTDCVVEGQHFSTDESPQRVGWKALARTLSDIAAMGGIPDHFLITMILRPSTSIQWVEELYQGIRHCAKTFNLSLVGGETASTSEYSANSISISTSGFVSPKNLTLRSTARLHDIIYVTGMLGNSILGKHLDFNPRIAESLWITEHFSPSAMMDLSDGLAQDLPRLSSASKLGYTLDSLSIPCSEGANTEQACYDGEDYELLFTLCPTKKELLEKEWKAQFPNLRLTSIGTLTQNTPKPFRFGWDHFST